MAKLFHHHAVQIILVVFLLLMTVVSAGRSGGNVRGGSSDDSDSKSSSVVDAVVGTTSNENLHHHQRRRRLDPNKNKNKGNNNINNSNSGNGNGSSYSGSNSHNGAQNLNGNGASISGGGSAPMSGLGGSGSSGISGLGNGHMGGASGGYGGVLGPSDSQRQDDSSSLMNGGGHSNHNRNRNHLNPPVHQQQQHQQPPEERNHDNSNSNSNSNNNNGFGFNAAWSKWKKYQRKSATDRMIQHLYEVELDHQLDKKGYTGKKRRDERKRLKRIHKAKERRKKTLQEVEEKHQKKIDKSLASPQSESEVEFRPPSGTVALKGTDNDRQRNQQIQQQQQQGVQKVKAQQQQQAQAQRQRQQRMQLDQINQNIVHQIDTPGFRRRISKTTMQALNQMEYNILLKQQKQIKDAILAVGDAPLQPGQPTRGGGGPGAPDSFSLSADDVGGEEGSNAAGAADDRGPGWGGDNNQNSNSQDAAVRGQIDTADIASSDDHNGARNSVDGSSVDSRGEGDLQEDAAVRNGQMIDTADIAASSDDSGMSVSQDGHEGDYQETRRDDNSNDSDQASFVVNNANQDQSNDSKDDYYANPNDSGHPVETDNGDGDGEVVVVP